MTTFVDSYAPATLFTTTTTSGPSATTTETTIIGTTASLVSSPLTLKSNVLDHAGRTIRFKASGYVGTTGTPTLQMKFKVGAATMIDTGTHTLAAITATNTWKWEGEITMRSTGSSATYIGQSTFSYFTTGDLMSSFSTANTATGTLNCTIDNTIDATAKFSSGPSNNLLATDVIVEIVN